MRNVTSFFRFGRIWLGLATMAVTAILPVNIAKAGTEDFTIRSFEADYFLSRDEQQTSQLKVVETIVAEFPRFDQNHGILRAIPKTYQGHTLSLHVESVKNPSAPWPYTTYTQNDNLVLKIGDPNRYVHGQQTFVITYTMRNVIAYFENDEFYWDVNGDQWQQAFGTVVARLHLPADVAAALLPARRCFAGSSGSSSSACSMTEERLADGGIVLSFRAANLLPRQTLTFVAGFQKGTFKQGPEVAREQLRERLKLLAFGGFAAGTPLATLAYMYRRWRTYGRDPSGKGVIVPEYVPPKGFNSLSSDFIVHEKLRHEALTALIVELATRRYITLYEIEKKRVFGSKSFELELSKDPSTLTSHEREVVEMFFGSSPAVGKRVNIAELKHKLHTKVDKLSRMLGADLHQDGYFTADPNKVRQKYYSRGIIALVAGFGLFFIPYAIALGVGVVLSGLVTILFARAMPARSGRGVTVRDYVLGLRDYIRLAEADRLRFLQAPDTAERQTSGPDKAQKIKLFESLLPYAVLFGLEKHWAKQFEHIYRQPPEWYHGNWSTFRTSYLASSIGGFSSAVSASFMSPSSSGSSGFGGGGSAGGGGGGGGGGGW